MRCLLTRSVFDVVRWVDVTDTLQLSSAEPR